VSSNHFGQGLGQLLAGMAPRHYYFHHTNDPTARLCYPHYSDPTFDGNGAIIYGAAEGVTRWIEGEALRRLTTEDNDVIAAEYGSEDTARRRQAVLRVKTGTDARLVCIIARTNPDNGYTRYRYGVED
jgi:hypothetical protein